MKSLFIACIFVLSSVSFASHLDQKIVGGVDAEKGEFPFMASLHMKSYGHVCGGSLIAKNWVLTAGHCVDGITINKVYVGLYRQSEKVGVEEFNVKKVVQHPDFVINNEFVDYDFALIELDGESHGTTIDLNKLEMEIPREGQQIMTVAAGWGLTSESSYEIPDVLQKVEVPLVHQDVCNESYKGKISDRMLCAGYKEGGKDACQGDSGGPLFTVNGTHNYTLVGLVSWGEGCAREKYYGVYSKVNWAADWIQTVISNN